MEFSEKLQTLRAAENLTQEELAKALYVSRTAISKWESGRGYPSIESLKLIAQHFHVTIDELIGGEELATLAGQAIRESRKKHTALLCGILDCLTALLLVFPIFGDGDNTVALWAMTDVALWLKITALVAVGLTTLNGLCGAVIARFDKPVWNKHRLFTGIGLSVLGTVLFMAMRQPYAGVFYLALLVIKGVLIVQNPR
ncbi:MAG: helix-turn-helix transcriptional regulator [Clostridia bacterium]|nr:helix-turn-helix transcriptional regulator [Clostridia bacterium]